MDILANELEKNVENGHIGRFIRTIMSKMDILCGSLTESYHNGHLARFASKIMSKMDTLAINHKTILQKTF